MGQADSKALQDDMSEEKVTKMLNAANEHVFSIFNPTNSEMVVFSLCVIRMMIQRAIESRKGYPKKMQIGTPSQHVIQLEIRNPTTQQLQQLQKLIQ